LECNENANAQTFDQMNTVITNNGQKCNVALEALHNVIDPEIGLNIVDLGLIYQVDFDDDSKTCFVSMTLTTQFCPMGDSIKDGAVRAMQQAFPDYKINVDLVFDPPWSTERVSESGLEYLNG
jgi:metal-sulfur cluster biosynthetic enzyme